MADLPREEFHQLLVDVVDGFSPAQPPIDQLRRRAIRRRRNRTGVLVTGVAVVVAAAVTIPLAVTAHHTGQRLAVLGSIRRNPAPSHRLGPPAPVGHGPDRHQLLIACRHYAATHSFLEAERAVVDPSGAVTITGHQGFETCGGPDDISYGSRHPTEAFVVAPSAVVRRVYFSNTGPAEKTIAAARLPRYLRHDHNGRFFRYEPPKTGIIRLVELYHP